MSLKRRNLWGGAFAIMGCLAIYLWIASYSPSAGGVSFGSGDEVHLIIFHGKLALRVFHGQPFDGPYTATAKRFLGFRYVHFWGNYGSMRDLVVPIWSFVLICAIVAVRWAIKARRERVIQTRLLKGRCPNCGYDLRVNSGNCPECGATAPPRPEPRAILASEVHEAPGRIFTLLTAIAFLAFIVCTWLWLFAPKSLVLPSIGDAVFKLETRKSWCRVSEAGSDVYYGTYSDIVSVPLHVIVVVAAFIWIPWVQKFVQFLWYRQRVRLIESIKTET